MSRVPRRETTQARSFLRRLRAERVSAQYVWCRGRPFVTLPLLMLGRKLLGAPSLLRTPRVAKVETEETAQAEAEYQEAKTRLLGRGLLGRLWLWLNLAERLAEAWARVGPGLLAGRTLVVDRYVYDSLVDLAAARGEADCSSVWSPRGLLAKLLPKPHVVFFIDVDVDTAMSRKPDVPSRRYLELRRGLYADLSRELGWVVLDGTQHPAAIAEAIWEQARG